MGRPIRFKLSAEDPERAMGFFERTFGWTFKKLDGPYEYYIIKTGDDSVYGIDGGMERRSANTMPNCTVIEIDSIDAALEKIVSEGGKIVIPKFEIPNVGYSAYFTDTEGNWFGLVQHLYWKHATPVTNKVLGITGSLATGKSTIAKMFADLGALSISADTVARDVLSPGSAISAQIIEVLGPSIAVKNSAEEVDRTKLGALIFESDSARKLVGEIMHPPIHAILSEKIESARKDSSFNLVVTEIPLLFENNLQSFVDKILVVHCSEPTQISRILARYPALTNSDADKRIQAQLPLCEKVSMADFVIDTDKKLSDVEAEVARIHAELGRS